MATNPNGPYSPALADAFRAGARTLIEAQSNLAGSLEIAPDAKVEEGPDGGVWVTARIFVSDADRAALAGEVGHADEDCHAGLHSWIHLAGLQPADTTCTRCGELYGYPD